MKLKVGLPERSGGTIPRTMRRFLVGSAALGGSVRVLGELERRGIKGFVSRTQLQSKNPPAQKMKRRRGGKRMNKDEILSDTSTKTNHRAERCAKKEGRREKGGFGAEGPLVIFRQMKREE